MMLLVALTALELAIVIVYLEAVPVAGQQDFGACHFQPSDEDRRTPPPPKVVNARRYYATRADRHVPREGSPFTAVAHKTKIYNHFPGQAMTSGRYLLGYPYPEMPRRDRAAPTATPRIIPITRHNAVRSDTRVRRRHRLTAAYRSVHKDMKMGHPRERQVIPIPRLMRTHNSTAPSSHHNYRPAIGQRAGSHLPANRPVTGGMFGHKTHTYYTPQAPVYPVHSPVLPRYPYIYDYDVVSDMREAAMKRQIHPFLHAPFHPQTYYPYHQRPYVDPDIISDMHDTIKDSIRPFGHPMAPSFHPNKPGSHRVGPLATKLGDQASRRYRPPTSNYSSSSVHTRPKDLFPSPQQTRTNRQYFTRSRLRTPTKSFSGTGARSAPSVIHLKPSSHQSVNDIQHSASNRVDISARTRVRRQLYMNRRRDCRCMDTKDVVIYNEHAGDNVQYVPYTAGVCRSVENVDVICACITITYN